MESKLKPYILIAPSLIIILFIMGGGLINCLVQSLGYFPEIGRDTVSLDYYREILGKTSFMKSFLFSLKTSLISSLICVVLGVVFAYFLSQDKSYKIRHTVINLPVIIPHIVVVILVFSVFSQSGIISRILYSLNIISDSSKFYNLVMDENGVGVILVYIWKGTPFVVITTYNILKSINEKLEVVSQNLGASKFQTFIYVTLPLAIPSIMSSFIILFAFSFGAYEVPFLIGPSTPKALPVIAYTSYISSDFSNRSYAMAMNVIISVISLIMLVIYNKLFEKAYKYKS